jgi:NAD(P)-dependent dehydrogenase (short-subunit alcohol dehydrogenase family)
MRNLVDQTVKRFGRLDVAVNNAGTEGHPGPVTEQTQESYAAVFDTNVLGTLLGMSECDQDENGRDASKPHPAERSESVFAPTILPALASSVASSAAFLIARRAWTI